MTVDIFLLIVTILYVCQAGVFLYGLRRAPDRPRTTGTPFISVVIAARNEESNLTGCLESLAQQTYDASKFEIIVVDDGSTDNTASVCSSFLSRDPKVRLIRAHENEYLRGKANALAQAIDVAAGEIILITDADCLVPHTWVEQTARRYADDIGLVGGFTLQRASNAFEGMQSLDWAFILGMAAATAGLGNPLGSIGNNLSFRKAAYDQVGGYRKLKFSVTEDYTLVQAIIGTKQWKYLYPLDPEHLVESKPCPDFSSLIHQKHRWGKGGLDMKFAGFVIMTIGFLMHIALFMALYWGEIAQAALSLALKSTADYVFLYRLLKRLHRREELRWFFWFEIYFLLYVAALPFLVFFGGKVKWKGREF
jgi:cellulose synthase/poly-beta-1,6-N-acetylglucosamine synthase-like glycosyltransferase